MSKGNYDGRGKGVKLEIGGGGKIDGMERRGRIGKGMGEILSEGGMKDGNEGVVEGK